MNSRRIVAFIIDYLFTALIMNIPFFIFVMIPLINGNAPGINSIILRTLISTFIALIYLILRDIPSKCSLGKRIFKIKVIDYTTKENAQVKQKLLRNLTWLLGPVEIIYFIITKKRIGDLIANTDVTLV